MAKVKKQAPSLVDVLNRFQKLLTAFMQERYPEVKKQDRINLTTEAEKKKMEKCMSEFSDGKLRSSSGETVTERDQAIAICLRQAKG